MLTCPTTAIFAGLDEGEPIALGKNLRFFGDGWQMSKVLGGRRFWRIPVMDGEFVCEETTGMVRAVGGGNFLVLARTQEAALAACEAAIAAMSKVPAGAGTASRLTSACRSASAAACRQLSSTRNSPKPLRPPIP